MQQRRTTIELVITSKAVLGVTFLVELAYVLCPGLPEVAVMSSVLCRCTRFVVGDCWWRNGASAREPYALCKGYLSWGF